MDGRRMWGRRMSRPDCVWAEFVKDHIVWIFKNTDWITEYNTPEKTRAYVDEHIND